MHNLMKMSDRFLQTIEVEACTPITAGVRPLGILGWLAGEQKPEPFALAKLVELRRRALGMTLVQLAERANVSSQDLYLLESGVLSPPILPKLVALAEVLQIRENILLDLAGVRHNSEERVREAARVFNQRMQIPSQPTQEEAAALEEFIQAIDANPLKEPSGIHYV